MLDNLRDSLRNQFAITPSDSDQLPHVTRSLYVAVQGDITLILADDTVAVLRAAVPVGEYPWAVKQVMDTGTDANLGLVGGY